MKRIIKASLLVLALGAMIPMSTLAAAADGKDKDFDYGQVDLRAGVWVDKSADEVYQAGERLDVGFQVNRDAYAVVYRIDTDGLVTVLWPRTRMDDGFVFAGHEYQVPLPGSAPMQVGDDEGEGYVEIVASLYPFDLRELEIDFHGEDRRDPYVYEVAGDPFLAMNEVNYAITGLEDTADYVVTNYTTYYVHRKVDHPRYLCSQCHVDDGQQYDPYRDHCTLDIEYDYGWSNRWYDTYGYYPVYAQPVYVYVDPWTYRPWVNFWYWPDYVCGPTLGYTWYSDCWAWSYSPYYYGDVYTYYNGGGRRYRPLTPGGGDRVAHKTRDYRRVTPLVENDGPDARQRQAMTRRSPAAGEATRTRTPAAGGGGTTVARGNFRGEPPVISAGPVVDDPGDRNLKPGLRIREPGQPVGRERSGTGYRHVAGDRAAKPALRPVTPAAPVRKPGTTRRAGTPAGVHRTRTPSGDREASGRTIKPVEPRRRGTRIWNSGAATNRGSDRSQRVQPRSDSRSNRARQTPRTAPRTRTRDSGDRSGGKSDTRVRSGDSGGSRTQGVKEPARGSGSATRGKGGTSSSRSSSGSRRR